MIPSKTFLYFLLQTSTGKAYYRTASGTILLAPITAGAMDVSLPNAPGNWLDTTLSFERNETYHGINRSYSTPQEFVLTTKQMIEEIVLQGVGTEEELTLAVFKYNSQPLSGEPTYKLYYKGDLDLSQLDVAVLETFTVNTIDGGVSKLLKAYENTELSIPCDGSLPENIKVNLDGLLVPDVLHYQFVPQVVTWSDTVMFLPTAFINNEGDNYGIVHSDQQSQGITGAPYGIDTNTTMYSTTALKRVRIRGSIVVAPTNTFGNGDGIRVTITLRRTSDDSVGDRIYLVYSNTIKSATRLMFDFTTDIAANDKIYLTTEKQLLEGGGTFTEMNILSGEFSISFNSQYQSTRTWAISAPDLWKLIVRNICTLAKVPQFNATSSLLPERFAFASGDALRASGDPTYPRFYFVDSNEKSSFGPVIKITLKQFFESVDVPLNAALSELDADGKPAFNIVPFGDVYNSDAVSFDIGEVASLKWRLATGLMFSDLSLGYPPQQYDQKAGKYEYNTTLKMKAPVSSFQKPLVKLSTIRWDSYGIEKLRSNIGTTSTTRNDSDNSVFGLNIDRGNWIYDYFKSRFTSLITDPDNSVNTNIHLTGNVAFQPLQTPISDGEYFAPNNDNAIFVFAKPAYSATEACNLTIDGLLNSTNKPPLAPDDTITIKLWRNGVVIYTNVTTVVSVNTPITINYNFNQLWAYGDSVYITMATTATADAIINTAQLTIGTYVSMSGANVPVEPGTFQKLLNLGTVIPISNPFNPATSHVQYGYQYFVFNSLVPNTEFNLTAIINGYIQGATTPLMFDIWVNGVIAGSVTIAGTSGRTMFTTTVPAFLRTLALGDIVFLSATVGNGLTVGLVDVLLQADSTYIKAYSLLRRQYDSLTGVPNLATDANGVTRTDIAGAPYNIEDVTPKTAYNRWKKYWRSTFLDKTTGPMVFQTLSKNEYLSRTIDGVTITENTDEDIDGDRYFYPIILELRTNVPRSFAELMSNTINAHIRATFMGNELLFFPQKMSQKPALNESQTWLGLMSPKMSPTTLLNITNFKLPNMSPISISYAFPNGVQFVPYTRALEAKYHTYNADGFLFSEQIGQWQEKGGYAQPVQIGDTLPMQFITREIDPIFYQVYKCDGTPYGAPQNLDTIASAAIQDPYVLWQYNVPTAGWGEGCYYIVIASTTAGPLLISECQSVRTDQIGTVLFEYRNSYNGYGLVFDGSTPFMGSMRVEGFYDNRTKQRYVARFYTDQGQDLTPLAGQVYETMTFSTLAGVPDYVTKKLTRILLMDGTKADGLGITLNDGAEWEEVFTKGAPKKLQSIEIRPTSNKDGISVTPMGIDNDSSLVVSVDAGSFGPNVSNGSGTTDVDLIEITVEG